MSELSDRSGPGVRVTVLSSELAQTGEPLNLDGRIISFTYEDSEGQADKLSLQLDNFDLALFDREEFLGGTTLEVSWGYPGCMAPPRRVVVRTLKGFQTLTVEGHANSVLMNRQAKTRGWAQKSRSDVAREIASEHGFEGAYADIEDSREELETINQTSETDARFLKRLAIREGFEFFVDDSGFHFRSRNQACAPCKVLTWLCDPGRGDIISLNFETDLSRRVGRVEVKGRNPLTKTTVEARASNGSVERTTLGEVIEVVDPETGTSSLQQRNATKSVHPTSAPTQATAVRESAARFRRAERETVKLSMRIVGDATLRAKTVLEVRGISEMLSGKYYVNEAKHVISNSGYIVDLNLSRDGIGSRGKAASHVQPQGGTPNRSPPSMGSEMTQVELIDPSSGASRISYMRDGRAIGGEDPEAFLNPPK